MGPDPVEDMPAELLPWLEDCTQERKDWLAEERRLTEAHRAERRRLRERLRAGLDAQMAEASKELAAARALGGRRCLPRGTGAALRMALRERGSARGRALRKVLAADARKARRRFPDSFAGWLELQGEPALAERWRRRGTLALGQASAPAPEPEESSYPRPGL